MRYRTLILIGAMGLTAALPLLGSQPAPVRAIEVSHAAATGDPAALPLAAGDPGPAPTEPGPAADVHASTPVRDANPGPAPAAASEPAPPLPVAPGPTLYVPPAGDLSSAIPLPIPPGYNGDMNSIVPSQPGDRIWCQMNGYPSPVCDHTPH